VLISSAVIPGGTGSRPANDAVFASATKGIGAGESKLGTSDFVHTSDES